MLSCCTKDFVVKALRKQHGILPNITDRDYITNSHHVPVWEKVGIFEKLEVEAPFCKYPTGGCITYVELDSTFVQNTKAIEQIIDLRFPKTRHSRISHSTSRSTHASIADIKVSSMTAALNAVLGISNNYDA